MDIIIENMFMDILLVILELLDNIMLMFRQLVGIEQVSVNGDNITLTEYFLQSSAVAKVFMGILIISLSICAICTIVAIVKTIINAKGGERKAHSKTMFSAASAFLVTLVMAGIMIGGVAMSNVILASIDKAFTAEKSMPIAVTILDMCIENNGSEQDLEVMNEVRTQQEKREGYNSSLEQEPYTHEKSGIVYNKNIWDKKEDRWIYSVYKATDSGYNDSKSLKDFMDKDGLFITTLKADDVLGTYKTFFGFPDKAQSLMPGIVHRGSFNMVLGYFMAMTLIVVLAFNMLGLVKRLYDLVILFLSLPMIVALMPIDDGAHFKIWRETVVSKVVLAYGCIIAVNVFMIITPLILKLPSINLVEKLLKGMLLVGGALAINGGQLLFARLMGTSAEEFRDMTNSARALTGGVMGTMGAMRGAGGLAKSALVGKSGKGGVLGVGGTALKAGANLAGNALGGNAYRGAMGKVQGFGGRVAQSLRGATGMYKKNEQGENIVGEHSGESRIMQNNGIVGAIRNASIKRRSRTGAVINGDMMGSSPIATSYGIGGESSFSTTSQANGESDTSTSSSNDSNGGATAVASAATTMRSSGKQASANNASSANNAAGRVPATRNESGRVPGTNTQQGSIGAKNNKTQATREKLKGGKK